MTRLGLLAAVVGLAACEVRTAEIRILPNGRGPGPAVDGGAHDAFFVPDYGPSGDSRVVSIADGAFVPIGDALAAADACSANLQTDPSHCGVCGNLCSFANALPSCNSGQCGFDRCLPGFTNLNNLPTDGCEYRCTVTNNGGESCDGVDNDCDGMTDEDTNLNGDIANCGGCRIACAFLRASAVCTAGQCALGPCESGFVDANGKPGDGCECAQTNGSVEICDGIDNDCNGKLDDVPDIASSNDPQHCGGCSVNCTVLDRALATCAMGMCVIQACSFGFADGDKQVANGCELACPGGFQGAKEVCDKIDNDCDGKTDADDNDMAGVGNFCRDRGECFGAQPACVDGGWRCNYRNTVELTGPNQIIGNETRCDGLDNDCDGCIDESFPQVGLKPAANGGSCPVTAAIACADDKKGQCQGVGHFVCNGAGNGISCMVDVAGQMPAAETCDNRDNNCDGIVDNSDPADAARIKDAMVAISGGGLAATVYIDTYEASRPDADGAMAGVSNRRACSKANAIPWASINYIDAAAACQAAGKRLCTEPEWQRACETAAMPPCTWSLGPACTTADISVCNVYERDADGGTPGRQNMSLATGALAGCFADWGAAGKIFDLTGNLREWTGARAAGQNPLRGGSFDTVLDGSTCNFAFIAVDNAFKYANSGFRCCSNTAP